MTPASYKLLTLLLLGLAFVGLLLVTVFSGSAVMQLNSKDPGRAHTSVSRAAVISGLSFALMGVAFGVFLSRSGCPGVQ